MKRTRTETIEYLEHEGEHYIRLESGQWLKSMFAGWESVSIEMERSLEFAYQYPDAKPCKSCKYYNENPHLHCAVHPTGPDGVCGDWEKKSSKVDQIIETIKAKAATGEQLQIGVLVVTEENISVIEHNDPPLRVGDKVVFVENSPLYIVRMNEIVWRHSSLTENYQENRDHADDSIPPYGTHVVGQSESITTELQINNGRLVGSRETRRQIPVTQETLRSNSIFMTDRGYRGHQTRDGYGLHEVELGVNRNGKIVTCCTYMNVVNGFGRIEMDQSFADSMNDIWHVNCMPGDDAITFKGSVVRVESADGNRWLKPSRQLNNALREIGGLNNLP